MTLVSRAFLENVLRKACRYDILVERGVNLDVRLGGWHDYPGAEAQWKEEEASDAADQ